MTSGTLVLAQALDAATLAVFYAWCRVPQMQERNPLVLGLMAVGGVQLVALVKVGAAALAARRAGRFSGYSRRWRLAVRLALSAATLSGCVGAGFNVAAILTGKGVSF